MVFRLASLTLLALLVSLSTVAHAAPREARLRRVHTWAFAIGGGDLGGDVARRYARVRPWSSSMARKQRRSRWRRCVARASFDGLFLDNTDMIESHPRQAAGMRRLAGDLGLLVHRSRGLLFTQNGEASIGPTLRLYDGWNREDVTSTYDFGSSRYRRVSAGDRRAARWALRRIAGRGLLTLATDYVASNDARPTKAAISAACSAGALPYVGDIGLRRVPARAFRC